MKRWLILWSLVVFAFVMLLGSPAAFWARWVDWPDGWEPQAVSGTLWQGQAQQIGLFGPVNWRLLLVGPGADVRAGALQRHWHLQLRGWPWQWRASLEEDGSTATPEQPISLEGNWEGRIDVRGRGQQCLSSEGRLIALRLDLLSPWAMPLGEGELKLDCSSQMRLLARLDRSGQHRFALDANLEARNTQLNGTVEKDSELGGLLRQFGLLKPGQRDFETRFDW